MTVNPSESYHCDYVGQKYAEYLYMFLPVLFLYFLLPIVCYWFRNFLIIFCGLIGFIYGYQQQKSIFVVYGIGVGAALSVIACVPAWPFYAHNPVKWLEPQANSDAKSQSVSQNKKSE